MFRIGQGYDVHRLAANRKLIIGGVELDFERGLLGHSDADVLLHAISDAILGAIGAGDIGHAFPDTDMSIEGISSMTILAAVYQEMTRRGYTVVNVDATILAERPKMAPYLSEMKENIAKVLSITSAQVNIKATTSEKLGFVGREEGMASEAVVLLAKK
ncbi:MAG: 2-C-methyl-D-erythritol 2,4-cyclodiphosphate synthase [Streptococcaceae bacterium]|jgi:2-C-methyl-D-erythritol 2,4-cyclodiphosphate synthase|nr:2-C-methyl-D-erythritol 2,4-cyclodiphosphate synthase [Streptococcaceae bacterium]